MGNKNYPVILLMGEYASGDFMQEHACESHTLEEWTKLAKEFVKDDSVILAVKTKRFDTKPEADAYIEAVQDCDEYNSSDFYTFRTIGPDRITPDKPKDNAPEEDGDNPMDYLDRLRSDPNNLSFWYPKVKDAAKKNGILTPKTVIIHVPDETVESFCFERDGDKGRVRAFVRDKVMPQLKRIPGLPFIKNGTFSDKFQFKTCCPDSADEDTITRCISDIQYDSLCLDTGGNTEIVLRERIESPESMPRIYGGMPLNTEFRVFYDFDRKAALYVVNYWDRDYCRDTIAGRNEEDGRAYDLRFPSLRDEFLQKRNFVMNKAHSVLKEAEGLTGIWSVDFLIDSRNRLWLIDMAEGHRSAYWDPARAILLQNQAEIKRYLDLNDPDGEPDISIWIRDLYECARWDSRDYVNLCCESVINAWQKAHPDTALPEEKKERTLVFIEKVLPDPEHPVRKALAAHLPFLIKPVLETLTAKAIETLVQN